MRSRIRSLSVATLTVPIFVTAFHAPVAPQVHEKDSWHGHLAHAWQRMNMGWKPMPRYFRDSKVCAHGLLHELARLPAASGSETASLTMWTHEATFNAMKTVGIRELKNRLSDYLRAVRSGESVLVTDRGEAVAEICALGYSPLPKDLPVGLVEMFKKGRLSLGAPNDAAAYPMLPPALTDRGSSRLLEEERGDG